MSRINIATDADAADWSAFAAVQADNHAWAWPWRRIIADSFGHQPFYLLSRDDAGGVNGILPLFSVKSLLFGRSLISMPYLNGGGVLATDDAAAKALADRAEALADEQGVAYVELRQREQVPEPVAAHPGRSHKVSMLLTLNGDAEALMKSYPAKLRSQIRRPGKAGIEARLQRGAEALSMVDGFYRVFAHNMRDLGTPVYPRQLFRRVLEGFGEDAAICLAEREGQAMAAGLTLRHNGREEILLASSLREFSKDAPNMAMYWHSIEQACGDGMRAFDFGRSSPDAGTYRFKKQWGAEPLPLNWHYLLRRGEMPDVNPNNPKFRAFVNIWQRLPLGITNTFGPWLTRSLP